MKLLILSDVHGNLHALCAVLAKAEASHPDINACILLGDLIDYGMHSNEVIRMVSALPYPILCNLCGNHESAIAGDEYARFSSERGRDSAKYTRLSLTQQSWDYIHREMNPDGFQEFEFEGKKCLAVHGSLEDVYWKIIDLQASWTEYQAYDYVFSGHSHLPHLIEKYFQCQDVKRRNQKKVTFINPGSVGQPRNLNPMAQFVVLGMQEESVIFEKANYDISAEQAAYHGQVDEFYCERLKWGI